MWIDPFGTVATMLKSEIDRVPVLTEAMLRRLDRPGPRYTSYPTADRFVEAFGPGEYAQALLQRASGATVGGRPPLSLYLHIPFCESVCYYCACNKVITRHHDKAAEYLGVLAQEVALNVAVLGRSQSVSQLHLGGGTPTFLSDAELRQLMTLLRDNFKLAPGAELSIEVDPRTASPDRLQHLATLGFNRLSFGVQDFDADVQKAVHRIQPFEQVRDLMAAARRIGFESINADLIYGLPKQTPESFARTVAQVAELRPDRIALYAYAHLPQRFKPQRRIVIEQLPPPDHRVAMLGGAMAGFVSHGYTYIGMDHFALPGDSLAVAKRQGRLHRNFQGYSTQPDCDLIGLGVSAIGRMGATYSQNAMTLDEYCDAVRHCQFPGARPGADPRRPGAPGGGDGADVPGPGGVRIDQTVVPDQGERLLQARARQPGRVAGSGPVHAGARRGAGHRHRLVLCAGGGHGVRPPPARRSAARALLAHHLGAPAWTRRCCSARC